jgi:5-methylcytosine-specific restriction enzyme A
MPLAAKHSCLHPFCPEVVTTGAYCDKHRPQRGRELYERRPESDAFYRTARWRRLRSMVLSHNPLCAMCEAEGRMTLAVDVDHVLPRSVRPDLEWSMDNCQPLCRSCHSRKTRRENARPVA